MPVTVTMHACSTCPASVDFTVFRCYLAGYSVEETVEHLMSLREHARTSPPTVSVDSHSPVSTPVVAMPAAAAVAAPHPDASSLQQEDSRQNADEAPSVLLPPEETLEVALLVENASLMAAPASGLSIVDDDALTAGNTEETGQGDRCLPRETARAPTVVPDEADRERGKSSSGKGKSKKTGKHSKSRHHHGSHTNTVPVSSPLHVTHSVGSGGAATFEDGKERKHTRHSHHGHHRSFASANAAGTAHREGKSRSFFLNEDYINFQRRLLQVEGGPIAGAPLSSELLYLETTEQYRLYELFIQEDFLSAPYAFLAKYYLPIAVADRLQLVELYYEVDAAVFRYFFGDRMQKFEPIDATHLSFIGGGGGGGSFTATGGLAGSGNGGGGGGAGSGGGTTNNAAAVVGGLLFRWAMRGSHNEEAIAYLLHINAASLRRQWENIKRVCTTMVNLYLGKSDMAVPRGLSLLEAIQQCYGIRGELATSYTTAVFGFHHRLTTRLLDVLHDFSAYSTLCNIIAAQWCDQSLLLLDGCFVDCCRRIGKLLDESRVLAELHQLMFGETLRPRWQVQLDEVQRAITTNSVTEKSTAAAAAAALTNMMTSPSHLQTLSPSPLSMSVHTMSSPVNGGVAVTPPPQPQPSALQEAHSGASLRLLTSPQTQAPPSPADVGGARAAQSSSPLPAALVGSPGSGSPTNAAAAAALSGGSGLATATQHSPLCANRQFSRRFMLEFPYMMRQLSKMAMQLGANASINDALETFYTRIFTYLEGVSSRTAPAAASMVLSAAAAAGTIAATTAAPTNAPSPTPLPSPHSHSHLPSSGKEEGGAAAVSSSLPGAFPRQSSSLGTAGPSGSRGEPLLNRSLAKVNSVPTFPTDTGSAAAAAHGVTRGSASLRSRHDSAAGGASLGLGDTVSSLRQEDTVSATSALPNPVTSIVNTSMPHPVTSLLPLSSFAGHPQLLGGSVAPVSTAGGGTVGEDGGTSGGAHGAMDGAGIAGAHSPTATPPPLVMSNGGNQTWAPAQASSSAGWSSSVADGSSDRQAFNPAMFGDVMLKALDKRYLRELSLFLGTLPRVWRQAHTLTQDDHATCDDAFTDFIVALKAITQIIMAADDFH